MTEKYFKSLNYSLGNEDTTFEVEMVKKLNPKKVLAVAGSGGRSLPLYVMALVIYIALTFLRSRSILQS